MNEITFQVTEAAEGGFSAEAIGESIFTQAKTWDELKANVKEAVQAFYFDSTPPRAILADVAAHKNVLKEAILKDL